MHRTLVLGSNYYNALSAIRNLGRRQIPTVIAEYDRSSYSLASRYSKELLMIPDPKIDPAGVLRTIIDWAHKEKEKPFLLPTHDDYMLLVDDAQELLRPHFILGLPQQGLARTLMNKDLLPEIALKHGLHVPKTVRFAGASREDAIAKIEGNLPYPFILKPDSSPSFVRLFRKKVFRIESREELHRALDLLDQYDLRCVAQQIIHGDDEHMRLYDAFVNREGEIEYEFTGQKLRQWPICFGASCLMQGRPDPELAAMGRQFLKAVAWRGFAEIEFKKDASDGKYYIIEINARVTNFDCFLQRQGFEVAYLSYADHCEAPPLPPFLQDPSCPYQFCYAHENRAAKKAYARAGIFSAAKLASQEKGRRKVYPLWDFSDPLPFFCYEKERLKRRLHFLCGLFPHGAGKAK